MRDILGAIQSYNRSWLRSLDGKTVGLDRRAGASLFSCLMLALDLQVHR